MPDVLEIFRREFSKTKFYKPSDSLVVLDRELYTAIYCADEKSDWRERTRAGFHAESREIGVIANVKVARHLRKKGYGREMVEAIERVFRQTGQQISVAKMVILPEFWEHMGYRLVVENPEEIRAIKRL